MVAAQDVDIIEYYSGRIDTVDSRYVKGLDGLLIEKAKLDSIIDFSMSKSYTLYGDLSKAAYFDSTSLGTVLEKLEAEMHPSLGYAPELWIGKTQVRFLGMRFAKVANMYYPFGVFSYCKGQSWNEHFSPIDFFYNRELGLLFSLQYNYNVTGESSRPSLNFDVLRTNHSLHPSERLTQKLIWERLKKISLREIDFIPEMMEKGFGVDVINSYHYIKAWD